MRSLSSITSLTAHLGVVAVVLLGTAKTVHSTPKPPLMIPLLVPHHVDRSSTGISGPPRPPTVEIDLHAISLPQSLLRTGTTAPFPFPVTTFAPAPTSPEPGAGWVPLGSENGPEVLTGPLPRYPELLRQAGVQGRVLLEAIVDTTGRIDAKSILVVSATNPEFVAAARQALLATLFRPAFTVGRAVRVRVRIPYEFTLTGGTGRAR
jgi:TonB family protein